MVVVDILTTFLQVQEHYIHNMGHFAKIDGNNIVIDIVRVPNDQDHRGEEFMNEIGFPGRYIQTSYNTRENVHAYGETPLRGNYACIGGIYDPELDVFYSQQPHPDTTLNTNTYTWEYPVPFPAFVEGEKPVWNSATQSWDIIVLQLPPR